MMGHPNRTFLSSNLFSICQHWTESCSVRLTAHTQMAWQQTVVSLFTVSIGGLTKMSKFIAAADKLRWRHLYAVSKGLVVPRLQQEHLIRTKRRLRIQILQSHLVVMSIPLKHICFTLPRICGHVVSLYDFSTYVRTRAIYIFYSVLYWRLMTNHSTLLVGKKPWCGELRCYRVTCKMI